MTLVKYNPYRSLGTLSETVDRFFGDYDNKPLNRWMPLVDITETENAYEFVAEIPGMEKKEIKLSLEDNVLLISGEKKGELKQEGRNYHRIERSHGKFERSFRLPREVKADSINAKYDNGILIVTVPKAEEAKAREISIS